MVRTLSRRWCNLLEMRTATDRVRRIGYQGGRHFGTGGGTEEGSLRSPLQGFSAIGVNFVGQSGLLGDYWLVLRYRIRSATEQPPQTGFRHIDPGQFIAGAGNATRDPSTVSPGKRSMRSESFSTLSR